MADEACVAVNDASRTTPLRGVTAELSLKAIMAQSSLFGRLLSGVATAAISAEGVSTIDSMREPSLT